jgi:hypothetical protein
MKNRLRHSDDQHHAETSEDHIRSGNEPSWFLSAANHQPRDVLVSRYRLSRNLSENPLEREPHARQHYATPQYRTLVTSQPRPPARFLDLDSETDAVVAGSGFNKRSTGLSLGQTFALAAVMAIVSGASVGFLNSQFSSIKSQMSAMLTGNSAVLYEERTEPIRQMQTVAATVISKKTVATATLKVSDVAGRTNSLIPLMLKAEPALGSSDLLLKISGLPDSAYLTAGTKNADRVWALTLDQLKDIKVMVPETGSKTIDLSVAAFEKNTGQLAAPIKSMTIALSDPVVIQPVAAPPPGATSLSRKMNDHRLAAIPVPVSIDFSHAAAKSAADIDTVNGDKLLKSGDLNAARAAYKQAWAAGAADGALGLARTYDPVVLASLKVRRFRGNTREALQWYELAAKAGSREASAAILRLKLKPQ